MCQALFRHCLIRDPQKLIEIGTIDIYRWRNSEGLHTLGVTQPERRNSVELVWIQNPCLSTGLSQEIMSISRT